MRMPYNFITMTDFYKFVHWKMYPETMTRIYSYCEARFGAVLDEIKFVGIVPLLSEFMEGEVVTQAHVDQAKALVTRVGGYKEYFNEEMWQHIVDEYGGKLPLIIKALPEGTVVKPGTPMFTVDTPDPKCIPLVNHSETILMHVWGMTTIASVGHHLKNQLIGFLLDAGLSAEEIKNVLKFMVHDFGYRGVSSHQSAGFLGLGFLASGFVGTDNMAAVETIFHHYNDEDYFGASVWATEHSVATSFGPGRGEFDYVNTQIDNAPDDAVISLVADSYDVMNFTENVIGSDEIAERIRKRVGRTVLRPDSGDPEEIVLNMLQSLANTFGYTMRNGYKILNHNIGILQGDGMDIESMPALYKHLMKNGWSPLNLVVGSGGGLLQKWNRDSLRFAIKASYGEKTIDEVVVPFDIFKDPKTANTGKETKASKRGLLKVQGNLVISSSDTPPAEFAGYVDDLQTVFNFGVIPTPAKSWQAVQDRNELDKTIAAIARAKAA